MVRSIVLAAALVAGLAAAPPARADALLDGLATMPAPVEDVRIAGTWDQGDKTGAYRVVIARTVGEAVTARLFVQWIAYHDDGSASGRQHHRNQGIGRPQGGYRRLHLGIGRRRPVGVHPDAQPERRHRPELRAVRHLADRISLRPGQ